MLTGGNGILGGPDDGGPIGIGSYTVILLSTNTNILN